MGSAGPSSTQSALLDLERSAAPPAELLDEAARILGVEFSEIEDELLSASAETKPRRSIVFAAKEEWVLRWLLKKTKPRARTTSPGSVLESSASEDPRKWLLFYYLVQKTPIKNIAKTIRDHDAMKQIQHALGQLVKTQKAPSSPNTFLGTQRSASSSSVNGEHNLPRGQSKKRKRSPTLEGIREKSCPTVLVTFAVLRALKTCLDDALVPDCKDLVSQQHIRIALSLAPETTAAILENVCHLVCSIIAKMTRRSSHEELLDLLYAALRLWDLRRGPDLGHPHDDCRETFTSHCLLPGLSLLKLMRDSELRDQHKDLEKALQKSIVQHALEPARKVFFDELVVNWKSEQDPILAEHIKPAVDRLQSLLCLPSTKQSHPGDTDVAYTCFGLVAPILLELAIRSSPRSTVKKSQHEQPWLEALLICLSHVGGCSVVDSNKAMQAPDDQRDDREPSDRGIASAGPYSAVCLHGLLSTAIQWKMTISLPLLDSLAQHFAGLHKHQSTNWDLVAKIMQLDINVFVPSSGMSDAKALLDRFIEVLDSESSSPGYPNNLALDRCSLVNLVSVLMEGFASARDLTSFVNIWMDRLAAVEASRISSFKTGKLIKPSSLWEDEDVMAKFSRVAKVSATPNFVESHLLATIQALRDKPYTGKHYALIVVLDILILTHKDVIESTIESTSQLCVELRDAVQTSNNFGRTTGLLWRLLRHILPVVGEAFPFPIFQGLVRSKEQTIIDTAMQNAMDMSITYPKPLLLSNDIERFHCFVGMAALSCPSAVSEQLNLEISSLTYHLANLGSGQGTESMTPRLWNGRVTSLEGKVDLLTALLGILLLNPGVLCLNIETAISLLKTMASYVEGSSRTESGFATLFEGLLADEALVSTPAFVRKCIEAIGLMDEYRMDYTKMAIIQALPKEAMSKAQRKHIGEWQRKMAAASKEKKIDVVPSKKDQADLLALQESIDSSTKDSDMTYGGFQQSCRNAQGAAALQTREDVISLCESFCKECPSLAKFLLLGSLLNKGDQISSHVTGLAANLSRLLPKSTSLEYFCLTADCMKTILDKHHGSINQWTIDTLLAQIAITTSSQGPNISNAAPIIFERLCRLLSVVLGRYRIRLGGRHHLLLPALYGLLRCLFAADPGSLTTPSQLLFHSKLPPWIHWTAARSAHESAPYLTRLLTSICDPTPSSVKRAHRNSLTDETKKARNTAGQYMLYFIAEYTDCQLNGRIEVQAKAALMPGLYAVLDAMGKEVMRAMNAKMSSSQKAIFKALYEDYVRFGKWDGM